MKYIEYSKQLKLSFHIYGCSLSFSFGCCFPIKVGKITILMVQRINIRLGIFPVECSHNIDAPDGLSGNSFAIASLSTSHLHPLECIALHCSTQYLLSSQDQNAAGTLTQMHCLALFTSLRPTSALACSIPFYSRLT